MKPHELIRKGMRERGMSQETLAKKLGFKYQSGITNRLNSTTSMRVDGFVRMCEAMGYEVIIRDKENMKVLGRVTRDPGAVPKNKGKVVEKKPEEVVEQPKIEIPVYEYKKR